MPPTTAQTTQNSIPANLTAILQAYGLPMPTGTNENAEPFWMINDQKISWAQMQTIIWQRQMAVAKAKGSAGAGGPENISLPSNADANFDGVPDVQFEQQAESGIEQQKQAVEAALEQAGEQENAQQGQAAQPTTKSQPKAASYLGDSPQLSAVDTTDVNSMSSFAATNISAPESSSKRFLAETLKKLLLILSLKI